MYYVHLTNYLSVNLFIKDKYLKIVIYEKKRKSFILFIGLGLSFSLMYSCSNDNYRRETEAEKAEIEMQKKAKSTVASQEIRALMGEDIEEKATRSPQSAYPDYFGGVYLDENFDIVMVIVGQNPENFRKLAEEKVKHVKVYLKKGDYSMNQLLDTDNKLTDFLRNTASKSIRENFVVAGLNEKENRIIITLKDISPAKVDEFKKEFIYTPHIKFEQGFGDFKI